MQFYNENALKPLEFWHTILWTDESMIRLRHSHGRVYVWRKSGDELSYKCTKHTVKAVETGLMVWGCMSASGVGQIVTLEGKINAEVYLNLLKEVAMQEGRK